MKRLRWVVIPKSWVLTARDSCLFELNRLLKNFQNYFVMDSCGFECFFLPLFVSICSFWHKINNNTNLQDGQLLRTYSSIPKNQKHSQILIIGSRVHDLYRHQLELFQNLLTMEKLKISVFPMENCPTIG